MTTPTDPFNLLYQLKHQRRVYKFDALHGPSVVVPNRDYKLEWTTQLTREGFNVFSGEHEGRVAWMGSVLPRGSSPALLTIIAG
jgi:hypothetical protein